MNDQAQLRNWVKAALGLKIVRDGLLPFMDQKCHDLYLSNETYTQAVCKLTTFACTQCSVKKLRPDHSENKCPTKGKPGQIKCGCQTSANKQTCPNGGSCGVLYDLILNQHVKTAPRWDNSDCSKWYKNGWEQMKCYIDIPGYNEKNNILQADITAFVHICQNHTTLKNQFRREIDKLIQVRTDRNEIFHSGDMDITDDKLKEYMSHMRDVLQIAVFNKLPDIQTYLDKLTKLETDTSSGEDTTQEIEARKDALKALIEESKALQEQNMNISAGATDINHQLAQLAVLQDNHMKCITEHLKSIKCHMQIVKEEHNKSAENLLQHSHDLKCITSAIEQHTTRLKDLQQEFVQQTEIIRGLQTVTMGIERAVTKNYRMISEIQSEIHTMLLIVEELHKHNQATATIEGKFVAEMNGLSNKVELTREAVQRLQSILSKSGPEASDTSEECLVKGELEKEGIILKDVQDGSVEMSFQCSIPTWIKVCKRCMDGSMATIFGPLQDHLRIKHGIDNLQITVDMYETDFVKSVEAIVKQLHPKLIAMLPNFAKSKCYGDPTQMKLDDVLRVVLEHAKSREPSFQITVAGKVEDSHAVSEKTDVSDTERSPSENDDTDVFDELQYATGEITSCEKDVSVTGTYEGEHTEGLQSATAEMLQTGKDAFLYEANEFEKLTSEQKKEKDTTVKVGAGSFYFLCPGEAALTVAGVVKESYAVSENIPCSDTGTTQKSLEPEADENYALTPVAGVGIESYAVSENIQFSDSGTSQTSHKANENYALPPVAGVGKESNAVSENIPFSDTGTSQKTHKADLNYELKQDITEHADVLLIEFPDTVQQYQNTLLRTIIETKSIAQNLEIQKAKLQHLENETERTKIATEKLRAKAAKYAAAQSSAIGWEIEALGLTDLTQVESLNGEPSATISGIPVPVDAVLDAVLDATETLDNLNNRKRVAECFDVNGKQEKIARYHEDIDHV